MIIESTGGTIESVEDTGAHRGSLFENSRALYAGVCKVSKLAVVYKAKLYVKNFNQDESLTNKT